MDPFTQTPLQALVERRSVEFGTRRPFATPIIAVVPVDSQKARVAWDDDREAVAPPPRSKAPMTRRRAAAVATASKAVHAEAGRVPTDHAPPQARAQAPSTDPGRLARRNTGT